MPVLYMSDTELAQLSGRPEAITDEDAVTFSTLTGDDLARLAESTGTITGWAWRCSCARCRGSAGFPTT
jgi:hypothetical protein